MGCAAALHAMLPDCVALPCPSVVTISMACQAFGGTRQALATHWRWWLSRIVGC
jgi:hypothetical protein